MSPFWRIFLAPWFLLLRLLGHRPTEPVLTSSGEHVVIPVTPVVSGDPATSVDSGGPPNLGNQPEYSSSSAGLLFSSVFATEPPPVTNRQLFNSIENSVTAIMTAMNAGFSQINNLSGRIDETMESIGAIGANVEAISANVEELATDVERISTDVQQMRSVRVTLSLG